MSTEGLHIPVVLGTARPGRRSEHAARYVLEHARAYGFVTELIDVGDYVKTAQTVRKGKEVEDVPFAKVMEKADGLIIVAPEYNHGYPGELKLLLDQLYDEYARKPVAICGVGGMLGGGRMVEMLRIAFIELQMVPIRNAVYFQKVKTLFDEHGQLQDTSYADRLKTMFDELAWYGRALKVAREAK